MKRFGMACIVALALVAGAFLLLMGLSNLVHPLVPQSYRAQNTAICLAVSGVGALALLAAVAGTRDIVRRGRSVDEGKRA